MKPSSSQHAPITAQTNFGAALRAPGLQPFVQHLLLGPKGSPQNLLYPRLSINALCRLCPVWRYADLPYGLNAAIAQAQNGRLQFLPVYDSEQVQQDSSKQDVGLLFSAGRPGMPFVLLIPGGAYINVAITVEGLPVAAALNAKGYHVFILRYRCGRRNRLPKPFWDLHAALHYLAEHVSQLQTTMQNYAVLGFSAGGHVAASLGTTNFGWRPQRLPQPAALILGYPLLSLEERNPALQFFIGNYMGIHWRRLLQPTYVLEHMDKGFPPCYLWQCEDDPLLPFHGNGLAFAQRAADIGLDFQFRPVHRGGHGMGLARGSEADGWLDEAVSFWEAHMEGGGAAPV